MKLKLGRGQLPVIIFVSVIIMALFAVYSISSRPAPDYPNSGEQIAAAGETATPEAVHEKMASGARSYRYFMRSLFISILLLLLLFGIAAFVRRSAPAAFGANLDFTILARRYLDQKNAVLLARSYGRFMLLSQSEGHLSLLTELDSDLIPQDLRNSNGTDNHSFAFSAILNRLSAKEKAE